MLLCRGVIGALTCALVMGSSRHAAGQSSSPPLPAPVALELTYRPPTIDDWPLPDPPAGYHWARMRRAWFEDVGLGFFFVSWVPVMAVAMAAWKDSDDPSYARLLIPVAGPFIELGSTRTEIVDVLLVVDGSMQALGALLYGGALIFPAKHLERDDVTASRVVATPFVTGTAAGVGLAGTF